MPRGPKPIYELEYPTPTINTTNEQGVSGDRRPLTLVIALEGYDDGGHAIRNVSGHIMAALEHKLLASFDLDEMVDYRSRRPAMMIDGTEVTPFEDIHLSLHAVYDANRNPFLLLWGAEPDLKWNAFAEAIHELVIRFGVDQTVALFASGMPVPHTRPTLVCAQSAQEHLIGDLLQLEANIVQPGAAALYLEHYLAEHQHAVAGYTAYIPPYLTDADYPDAALGLLGALSKNCGISVPVKALQPDLDNFEIQIKQHLQQKPDLRHIVAGLENNYDAYMAEYRKQHPQAMLKSVAMPSSDELGAEFERYLAAVESVCHDKDDRDDADKRDGHDDERE